MSSTNNNVQQDADKAKKEAHNRFQETYDKASAEAKELERKGADAAKRGEKKAKQAYNDASKEASAFWDSFSNDPKKWATTLGAVNAALVAGVGIFAYQNQDQVRTWDRSTIGAISAGVLALIGGQTYFATVKAQEQTGNL